MVAKNKKKLDIIFLKGKNRCMTIAYNQMYISHGKNKGLPLHSKKFISPTFKQISSLVCITLSPHIDITLSPHIESTVH
jgi:hypothetical protein